MTRVKATLDVKTTTSFIEDPTEPDEIPTDIRAPSPEPLINSESQDSNTAENPGNRCIFFPFL